MKRLLVCALGAVLFLIFVLYMITFQVNFDKTALLVTFGRSSAASVYNADGKSGGLYFKWPWPIQKVIKFDRRVRVVADRLEQQETKDKKVVVLKTYFCWQVSNPLEFYRSLRTYSNATVFLTNRVRTARAEIGRFTFDELTNVDPAKLRIAEAEKAIYSRMKNELAKQQYGIKVKTLGITRVLLPEQISSSVFERMKQTRQRLAQNARSEGQAIAKSIIAKANSDRQRILAFAGRQAQQVMSDGDATAAQYYKIFAKNEKFAIFLRKMEALKKTLANNTTFLIDTRFAPFDLLDEKKQEQLIEGMVKKNAGQKK